MTALHATPQIFHSNEPMLSADQYQEICEKMTRAAHQRLEQTVGQSGQGYRPNDQQKAQAQQWFEALRDQICAAFESLENQLTKDMPSIASLQSQPHPQAGKFIRQKWNRPQQNGEDTGGGTMSVMTGRVFEKVGVNVSTVYGTFPENFRNKIPGAGSDGRFWASGISLVAHMANPHVPAVHMNTRHIITSGASWFGGGADLTPCFQHDKDSHDFHRALQTACDHYAAGSYDRYKKWCDAYFHLYHRNEPRGIGGIFYDYINSGDWEHDFDFTQQVGRAFLDIYPHLVQRRMNTPFTAQDRQALAQKRSRYVEFNLLYDRGTQFGLKTKGNIDAILMSMPPVAEWPSPLA